MRRTLLWTVFLVAALAGAARWYWNDLWSRRNELLAEGIRHHLTAYFPEWRVDFDRAEWEGNGQVRLGNVRIAELTDREPLIVVPEVTLHLDPDLLREGLQVFVNRVELHRPQVLLLRNPTGVWNWEDLPDLPSGDRPAPDIFVRDGAVEIRVEADGFLPRTEFHLRGLEAVFANESFQRYRLRGRSTADTAGAVEFEGTLNVETWAWSLDGRCAQLRSPDALLELAARLSEETRTQLHSLARQMAVDPASAGGEGESAIRPASRSQPLVCSPSGCAIPALGIAARIELAFHIDQSSPGSLCQYQIGVRFADGVIDNPALPAPLRNLSGEVYLDNAQIILHSLQAATGDSRLFLEGRLSRDPAAPARRFTFQAKNLEFGREIQQHLWGNLLQLYESLRPAGRFNVDIAAATDGRSPWQIHLNQFEVFDCSLLPQAFPYPVQAVAGDIRQQEDRFLLNFTGLAGDRPFTAQGEVSRLGPGLELAIDFRVENLPLDDTLRRALTADDLDEIGTTLDHLRLSGLVDVQARLVRTGRSEDPWKIALHARFHQATVNFVYFPYPITELSLVVRHDPLTDDPGQRNVWQILDIQGRHGPARISGSGAFGQRGGQSLLDLQLSSRETPIDRDLELACVAASPLLQEAFDSIGRSGTVDVENARILWTPAAPPVIVLPTLVVKDASVRLKYWPYTWERVTGTLAWEHDRLLISQLTAWHGADTYLQIDNHGEPTAAVLEFPSGGDVAWHLHVEEIQVRRAVPDVAFRAALQTTGLAGIVEHLDPRGPLDLQLGLDLKGSRHQPDQVTAAWTLEARLLGNSLRTGIELRDMNGWVRVERGLWDGYANFIDGHFHFDSVTVLGLPVTHVEGPFLVNGSDVYVGTPTWPEAGRPPPADPDLNPRAGQQARGDIYGGKLGLDVHARLSDRDPEQTVYRASITLRDALLEEFARDHGLAAERLQGPVNGRIDLLGRGLSDRNVRGSGWVQISPAQLYELPVLNRMLASLELRQPDTTAFRYAYGQFTLHDGLLDFSEIQLLGESLLLVGRGSVAFGAGMNEQLAIEFLRSKFRNRIPVFGQAISAVTSNSIGVRVSGTLSAPVIDVQPKLGLIDDTLRKLIEGFEAGQMPGPPRMIPLLGPPAPRPAGRPQ